MISPVLLNAQKYPKAAGRLICFGGLFGVVNFFFKTPLALKKLVDEGSLKICGDLLSYRLKVV